VGGGRGRPPATRKAGHSLPNGKYRCSINERGSQASALDGRGRGLTQCGDPLPQAGPPVSARLSYNTATPRVWMGGPTLPQGMQSRNIPRHSRYPAEVCDAQAPYPPPDAVSGEECGGGNRLPQTLLPTLIRLRAKGPCRLRPSKVRQLRDCRFSFSELAGCFSWRPMGSGSG